MWDGRSFLAAERVLPLEKGVNMRDVGGFHTADGQMVRWGKLYRSGSLSRLTPADLTYLQRLGVRLVFDLRSVEERTERPDRFPTWMVWWNGRCPWTASTGGSGCVARMPFSSARGGWMTFCSMATAA